MRQEVMASTPPTAAAFVMQAAPWTPLVVRRGSSAEVSVDIPLKDDDDVDAAPKPLAANTDGADTENGRCLVWQFRVEEYDVAFQIVENGQPLEELTRYSAVEGRLDRDTRGSGNTEYPPHVNSVSAEGIVTAARGCMYTFRWDNSYSIVRHKRVFYRHVVTSSRAVRAAQTAAIETQERQTQPRTDEAPAKPRLAKRLALERRLTVDEVSLEQTRAIGELQRCVTDMVSMFMTDPDRPLHEGSIREFLLSLEAVLRNGIKEACLRTWPEEPYYEFLLQIEHVLRDDKHLVDDVKALPHVTKLQYLGWTRSRSLLMMALNRNMLHSAFENLIKRRSAVESYYDSHALLFMYSSATQIASYLSALNGVKFLLAASPEEDFLLDLELPPNLKQCAPDDIIDGEVLCMKLGGSGYVLRTGGTSDPDGMKRIEHCSVVRNLLIGSALDEVTIGRGQKSTIEVQCAGGSGFCLAFQICVVPGDIAVSVRTSNQGQPDVYITESLIVSPDDGWTEVVLLGQANLTSSVTIVLDNSNAMMRARQVAYRVRSTTPQQFDAAWESAQGVAQSISWKIATRAGVDRCRRHMQGLILREQQAVAEQQQRNRESSGSNENDHWEGWPEDDTLFGMGASLISKPVSYLVGGLINFDGDNAPGSCTQCLTPFSFFSRQCTCPSCQSVVCAPCSRHTTQIRGRGPQVKVCDRCFIRERDEEKKRRAMLENGSVTGGECATYAALRVDPNMEKYFKMLSFGVAHSGVAQKMLQDEMPSDKIVVFSAGPAGAGDDRMINPSAKGHGKLGQKHQPANSFRKVHWKSLESKRAITSIWNRETSRRKTAPIRLSPQDFQEVALLFGREKTVNSGNDSTNKGTGVKSKPVFNALDSRRSNNISIGLSQFKNFGGSEAILKSVSSCDFSFLTPDRLSTIYEIAPSSVETKRYTNFRGSRSRLDPAERFLVDMCDIPRVTEKIAAMRFVAQFESQQRELQHRVQIITDACYQLLKSERLARFFELILKIGNLLNTGTEVENAGGVTLESLLKLSETKSVDQTITLLHFIVRLIHDRGEGDVLLFVQELSFIAEAKRFSNIICYSQSKALQSGVAQAEQEIKEEMLLDLKRFKKEEEKRRDHRGEFSTSSTDTSSELSTSGNGSERDVGEQQSNPRMALLKMIRQRGQQIDGSVTRASSCRPSNEDPAPSGALLPAISMRANLSQDKTPEQDSSAHPPAHPRKDVLTSSSGKPANTCTEEVSPSDTTRAALMDANIRMESQKTCEPPSNKNRDAQSSDLRLRANLLSAIRSRGPRGGQTASSVQKPSGLATKTSAPSEAFTPRVYSADSSAFITVMRQRLFAINTAMEQLEVQVETMVSAWESTARYLGEDPVSSSSEYVLQLLNRFILDVKIAISVLWRQGLSFHSPGLGAPVGSVVATKYGPGIIAAIRGDTKLEVLYPWSREAYLSLSMILSVGAVVRSKTFGLGIIHSTHYERGFCSVRFGFGIGTIRVQDLSPAACSHPSGLKRKILAGGLLVGDLVTTPFGCGYVRSILPRATPSLQKRHRPKDGYVAVSIIPKVEWDHRVTPVAFVQLHLVRTNY